MSAPLLMVASTLLFATMGMCVKFVSAEYSTGEIVFYRGLVGAAMMLMLARMRGSALKTRLPSMHFWRSVGRDSRANRYRDCPSLKHHLDEGEEEPQAFG